ncbi:uncharacterized protein LOC131263190 isoform X2 [Anopheles coustani]|uniref:uncharacterized protein LOC131263190 isoform X2 n=1 Tax=Anopheles coustani TaxID=139045 RepID=UPI00265A06D2|nr:uncharacterized protein LOC131263190 isoform X2 [Anopheles coustani]
MTRTNRADGVQRLPPNVGRECLQEIKQEDPLQLAQEDLHETDEEKPHIIENDPNGPPATVSSSPKTEALDGWRSLISSESGVAFDRWFHTISARLSTLEKAFSSQAITIALLTEEKDQLKTANARNESSIAQLRKELQMAQNSQRALTTEKSSDKASPAKQLQQASNVPLAPRLTTLPNTSAKVLTTAPRQAIGSSGQILRNNIGCKRQRQSSATPSSDDETRTSDIPSPRASSSPPPLSPAVPSTSTEVLAEEFYLVPVKKSKPRSNISASIPNSDSQTFNFTLIASVEELKKFEADLGQADGIYRQKVYNWLRSSLTPCDYFRTSIHEAIDLLFCRKFFAKLSWSGNGVWSLKDIPFRAYTNIVELFVDVAKSNGANPTRKQITDYIQIKLRHARRRTDCTMVELKMTNARNESLIAQLKKELQMARTSQRALTTEVSSDKAGPAKQLQQARNVPLAPRITTLSNTSAKVLAIGHLTGETRTSDIPSPRASSSPPPLSPVAAVPSTSTEVLAEEFYLVPVKKSKPRSNISASIPNSDSQSFNFTLIASVEELKKFEADLGQADGIYRQEVFDWLRSSLTPCEYFQTPIHETIDLLFCRKFFAKLSWAGNGVWSLKDIPFRAYTNIVELFVDVAKSNGANPTRRQITDYIQIKLRHARRRLSCKMLRKSTTHIRNQKK